MFTANTFVISPRKIANGIGAWEGTLKEGIEEWDSKLFEIIGDEIEDLTVEEIANRLTLEDIQRLLDDPNAVATDFQGDLMEICVSHCEATEEAKARAQLIRESRNLAIKKLATLGVSHYRIAKRTGITQQGIAKIVQTEN